MTKRSDPGNAHFLVAGTPVCAPFLAPFKSVFIAFDPWSHLCTICRREEAKARGGEKRRCTCGKCRVLR